jgi:hypothetical protein
MSQCIQSVSIPRSGHHFLVKLLRRYFNEGRSDEKRMSYCEYYNCCSARPCQLIGSKDWASVDVHFQKSHDEYLRHPDGRPEPPMSVTKDTKHLIQFRHPIPSTISDYRLVNKRLRKKAEKENMPCPPASTEEQWMSFAKRQLKYRIRFLEKWVLQNPWWDSEQYCLLNYETLVTQPLATLCGVVRFALPNEEVNLDRAQSALAQRPVKAIRNPLDFEFASTLSDLELICSDVWAECEKKLGHLILH